MSKSKAVATIESNLPVERPSFMGDPNKMSRGNEGVKVEDLTIPRLSIIQDLSPQHKEGKSEYIEGAKPKMIFNTVTGKLYGDAMFIVPVLFRKEYVIWKDLDKGGGFRGAYPTLAEAKEAMADLDDRSDCEIVDTAHHFVLIVDPMSNPDDPKFTEAVISMSKSQMKVSRRFNSIIQTQGGDRWERMFKFSVVDDKNAAGQEYYNWKAQQLGYVSESLFRAAEELYEAIRTGAMDVNRQAGAVDVPTDFESEEVTDDDEF